MTICDETFALVKQRLEALDYDGPVALACDDTKLVPSWRLHWNSNEQTYFVVGATCGPLRVADPEALQQTVTDVNAVQATKVRLYTIQVPLPGIAPIIVAALPISDSMDGPALYGLTRPILYGLLEHGVHVASQSSDGSKTERAHSRIIRNEAPSRRTYSILGPRGIEGFTLTAVVSIIHEHPIAEVQDALHGSKTSRNNLFAGARLLTFGNYTMMYRRIRNMALDSDTPLYWRDVERLDRQDDNAAARLFSSRALEQLLKKHPDALGEVIYLYIFGELTDAYQNRYITHRERLRMILRVFYFVKMWQNYLRGAGYAQSRYCISSEALDIIRILVEGLYTLIIIYRDYYCKDGPFPLLPWLHSTEPVEHSFGCARRERPDFALMELYDMIKKLRIQMHESVRLAKTSDAKARASGYSHTYFDARDINLHALSTYMSDEDIPEIALEALEDAEALVAVLGVVPAQVHSNTVVPLSIDWMRQDSDDDIWNSDSDDGTESESDSTYDDEPDEVDFATELQRILHEEEQWDPHRLIKQDDRVLNLSLAAAALTLDDIMHMCVNQCLFSILNNSLYC